MLVSENMQSMLSIFKHEIQLLSFFLSYVCPNSTHYIIFMQKDYIDLCMSSPFVYCLSCERQYMCALVLHLFVKLKQVSKPLRYHSLAWAHDCSLPMCCLHFIVLRAWWSWQIKCILYNIFLNCCYCKETWTCYIWLISTSGRNLKSYT